MHERIKIRVFQVDLLKRAFVFLIIFLCWGCAVKTKPTLFETRLFSYSEAVQGQNEEQLRELSTKLTEDLKAQSEQRDIKLYALRSEVEKQIALIELLKKSIEARDSIGKSLHDAGITFRVAERSNSSPDWIRPSVYNNIGDLLTIKGMIVDHKVRGKEYTDPEQRKEAYACAATYHLAALGYHLQGKKVTGELLHADKDPSAGLRMEMSKSDERVLETLSRAVNDLSAGDVMTPVQYLEIINQAKSGKPDEILSHFELNPDLHKLTGSLFSTEVSAYIMTLSDTNAGSGAKAEALKGCLNASGLAVRHYAVAEFLFLSEACNQKNRSLQDAVTSFVYFLNKGRAMGAMTQTPR